tara:strand:+ start:2204 stop:2899 length:696 start_codon:yes stop_codon:yes gene_type:complete
MQAKDVMTHSVVSVSPDTPVSEIARKLIARGISAVPVLDEAGKIVGIVSEGDLMRRDESGTERRPSWWLRMFELPENKAHEFVKTHGLHARDVMTREVTTVSEDTPINEIAELLEYQHIKRVPVVRDGRPVGIVSRANLLFGLAAIRTLPAVNIEDEAIQAELMTALKKAGVRTLSVNVLVSGGVVDIWGDVSSEDERRAAGVAAEGVPGVVEVRNRAGVMSETMKSMYWE